MYKSILINPKAELKLRIAINHAKELEIMWFGEVKEDKKGKLILKDIFFPPQINKPTYVETDDERLAEWMYENITKKKKNKHIRLHGHTHPVFNTKPSDVDNKHVKTFLKETGNDYFIQMILSNTHKPYCKYHDNKGNSNDVKILWNYGTKIKKIMKDMMTNESKQTY